MGPLPALKAYRDIAIARCEHDYLVRLMSETAGDITQACAVSGLKRARLYDLLKRHGVARP